MPDGPKLLIGRAIGYQRSGQANRSLALVNAAFFRLIKAVAELHINADEPAALEALGSNLKSPAAQTAYFAANEFAASDHDPIVVALNPLAGDLNDVWGSLGPRYLVPAGFGRAGSLINIVRA